VSDAPAAGGEANPHAPSTAEHVISPAAGASPPGGPAGAGRSWLLIRLTGLLLSVLVLGHLLAVHLLTDVAHTTSSFVLRRWSTALWIGWDGTMLTAALAHGAAGIWAVLRDHLRPGRCRRAAVIALLLITLALAGLGWYTIAAVVQQALAAR
jgi:succinate dehydrogenase hydrophobic anchor subunit